MGYTDRGLGIGDLSIGVSTSGLETYKDSLKASLLTSVAEKINDFSAVEAALNKGWQGEARDTFDKKFEKLRQSVIMDLWREYNNLENRIEELAYNYVQQDRNMIID